MSGILGTQLDEDYIQVGDVKLPLPKNPDNRGEEYEMLRTTPLEPFQASVVIGDDSLISDDRIAQAVFSDFRPGLGKRRYTEVESVNGYQDGDLLTVEGVATLPPFRNLIATAGLLSASVYNTGTPMGFLFNWTQRYRFAAYSPSGIAQIWDSTTSTFGALIGPPAGTPPYNAFARFAGYWVYCVNNAGTGTIWYSTDGKTYTAGWAPGGTTLFLGLQRHDGKLYVFTYDTTTRDVVARWVATQAQLTAGVGVAWAGVSVEPITLEVAENVTNIVDWKDKVDDRQLYIVTTRRLIAYNDADFWTDFWLVPDPNDSYRPFALVNPRDDLLYVCFGGQNDSVFVFNHQTVEEMGPNREFGLAKSGNDAFSIYLLAANSRHMFAFGGGQQGRVLLANDSFGWGGFVRATLTTPSDLTSAPSGGAANRINGMFFGGGRLVFYLGDGTVQYITWPDQAASVYKFDPTGVTVGRSHEQGPFWMQAGEFDAGNELLWKLAKYWTIHLEMMTGVYALPTGTQAFFRWRYEGGAWSSTVTMTSVTTFPYRIPLPLGGDQRGEPFRKLEWQFGLQGTASFNYSTPIFRAAVLTYTREPDIYDGLQCVVDLSEDRWDQMKTSLFYGLDRAAIRNYLDTLKSGPGVAKRHYPVVIGWSGYSKTYASMDVRVSGVEDPQDRYGKFSLTLRDLTAPPSG